MDTYLLNGDGWPPVLVLLQDGQAHLARGVHIWVEQRRFKLAWSTGREETFLEAGAPCLGPAAPLAPLPYTRQPAKTSRKEKQPEGKQTSPQVGGGERCEQANDRPRGRAPWWGRHQSPAPQTGPQSHGLPGAWLRRRQGTLAVGEEGPGAARQKRRGPSLPVAIFKFILLQNRGF